MRLIRHFLRVLERKGSPGDGRYGGNKKGLCFDFDGTLTMHPLMAAEADRLCRRHSHGDRTQERDYFQLSTTACGILSECTGPQRDRWQVYITSHNTGSDIKGALTRHVGPQCEHIPMYRYYDGNVYRTGKRKHMQAALQHLRTEAGCPDAGANSLLIFDDHPANIDVALEDDHYAVLVHKEKGLRDDDLRVWLLENTPITAWLSPHLHDNLYDQIQQLSATAGPIHLPIQPAASYELEYCEPLQLLFLHERPIQETNTGPGRHHGRENDRAFSDAGSSLDSGCISANANGDRGNSTSPVDSLMDDLNSNPLSGRRKDGRDSIDDMGMDDLPETSTVIVAIFSAADSTAPLATEGPGLQLARALQQGNGNRRGQSNSRSNGGRRRKSQVGAKFLDESAVQALPLSAENTPVLVGVSPVANTSPARSKRRGETSCADKSGNSTDWAEALQQRLL